MMIASSMMIWERGDCEDNKYMATTDSDVVDS